VDNVQKFFAPCLVMKHDCINSILCSIENYIPKPLTFATRSSSAV
jgi:hypothetical protein